jgi:hypothetical protein
MTIQNSLGYFVVNDKDDIDRVIVSHWQTAVDWDYSVSDRDTTIIINKTTKDEIIFKSDPALYGTTMPSVKITINEFNRLFNIKATTTDAGGMTMFTEVGLDDKKMNKSYAVNDYRYLHKYKSFNGGKINQIKGILALEDDEDYLQFGDFEPVKCEYTYGLTAIKHALGGGNLQTDRMSILGTRA